jgi:phospholipid/cholesterol/gamma-HCH transport system ATP-binding protein
MEIGDNILYMYEGYKQWTGSNKDIIYSEDEKLNAFIFASEFLQDAKHMRMMESRKDDNRPGDAKVEINPAM